jgi:hypothetical protein
MSRYKEQVKIAFIGAQGVGKTTISNQINLELKKIGIKSVVLETPRSICKLANDDKFLRRGQNSALKQSLIILGQIVNEFETMVSSDVDVQICDRNIIDHWSFSLYLFKDEFEKDKVSEIFEYFILNHYKSYDLVYYYPIERFALDDGVRDGDLKFQKDIDEMILNFINKHKLKHKVVSSKSKGYLEKIVSDIMKLI